MTTAVGRESGHPSGTDELLELTRQIREKGLLKKQQGYYWLKIVFTLALLGLSVAFIVIFDSLWLHLLNALFLSLVFGQLGFLGHDAGHRQVFVSNRWNHMLGLGVSFLLGMERTWWVDKHNRHHSNPNEVGKDPDIDIPILAFSEEDAMSKRGFYRFMVKYQPYFFFLLLSLDGGFGLRLAGVQFMFGNKLRYPVAEPLFMAGHFVVYFALLFLVMPPLHAVLFIVVHQLVFGFYMGFVFAPNHKGMPIVDSEDQTSFFRRQAITSRNIRPNRIIDFMYGGLNYQIEHHLYPNMPRNQLGQARRVVKRFCQTRGIPYHETGVISAQIEIVTFLNRVSAPLRGGPRMEPDPAGGV